MSDQLEKIHFVVTKELIEAVPQDDYEVLERLQDGEPFRLYRFKPFAANFLVDENGQPIPHKEAMKRLGKIPLGEWAEIAKKFMDASQEAAIPNPNGSRSNSPSEAVSAAPSQDGSVS